MSSVLTVTDQTNFNGMASTMFTSEFLLWNVDGKIDVTVTLWGISMTIADITFLKSITLPGNASRGE